MKQGVSKIRNPVIARVFRELGHIEQWGSGVRRIFAEAAALNLPAPQIIEIGIHVRFIVPLLAPIITTPPESGPESIQQKVLVALAEMPLSKSGIAKRIGHKSISSKLNERVREMLDCELIEYTHPEKPQSRLQKYRITPQGRALLKS